MCEDGDGPFKDQNLPTKPGDFHEFSTAICFTTNG